MSVWTIVAIASFAVAIAVFAIVLVSAPDRPSTATENVGQARDGTVGSNAWAQQVMSKTRCRSCRKTGYDMENLVLGPPRSWYRGRCQSCGEARDFEFPAPE